MRKYEYSLFKWMCFITEYYRSLGTTTRGSKWTHHWLQTTIPSSGSTPTSDNHYDRGQSAIVCFRWARETHCVPGQDLCLQCERDWAMDRMDVDWNLWKRLDGDCDTKCTEQSPEKWDYVFFHKVFKQLLFNYENRSKMLFLIKNCDDEFFTKINFRFSLEIAA